MRVHPGKYRPSYLVWPSSSVVTILLRSEVKGKGAGVIKDIFDLSSYCEVTDVVPFCSEPSWRCNGYLSTNLCGYHHARFVCHG